MGGFKSFISGGSQGMGFEKTGNATTYREYSPQQVDATALQKNITDQSGQLKDQNVNSFNSAVSGTRGINPALAAYMMGNNLAQANTAASQQATNASANAGFQAQQANQQAGLQANAQNSQNYNAAQGINQNYNEGAANRTQATISGLLQGGGAAIGLLSDENLKEEVGHYSSSNASGDDNSYYDEDHEMLMGRWRPKDDGNSQLDRGTPFQRAMHEGGETRNEERMEHANGDYSNRVGEVDESDKHVSDFLESLTPHMYKYKQGTAGDDGGKPHLGIMAQNIEKTTAGKGIVQETEAGKQLDVAQLSGSLAAGLGAVHRRLAAIEALTKKGKI